ncbi:hypothetical protein D3C84_814570 [compost metagenome]
MHPFGANSVAEVRYSGRSADFERIRLLQFVSGHTLLAQKPALSFIGGTFAQKKKQDRVLLLPHLMTLTLDDANVKRC